VVVWELFSFDQTTLDTLVDRFQPLATRGNFTLPNTLNYVLKHLAARTAILEPDYVCRHYRSAFSALYSKRFKPFSALSNRLHFFKPDKVSLSDLAEATCSDELGYLGYVVLRPTDICAVGRTVLERPTWSAGEFFLPCTTAVNAHVLGLKLTVTCMPFTQQDTMVMTCAQAAIWMATQFMSQSFGMPGPLPHEITESCSKYYLGLIGRPVPSGGLLIEQMINGLFDLGYSPVFERASVGVGILELVYKYIESKVPVIIIFKSHAMTVCGYIYDFAATAPKKSLLFGLDKVNLTGYENWIRGLIVHDDSVGPYRLIPTNEGARNKLIADGFSDLLLPANWPDEGTECCTTDQIEGLVIPLPEKVYLTGESVYAVVATLLEDSAVLAPLLAAARAGNKTSVEFLNSLSSPSSTSPIVLRAYFLESQSYKSALRTAPLFSSIHPVARDAYLRMRTSRLIWIIELTLAAEMRKEQEDQRRVYGEIILDSTASPYSPSFLAIHLPGVLHIRDPKDESWSIEPLKDDKPYQYPRDFV
jgi:hypothetical protein